VLLGEAFGKLDALASFTCLIGVSLVTRPQFLFPNETKISVSPTHPSEDRVIAILLLLFGSFISALAYCSVRRAGGKAHFLSHVFSFGLISTILSPFGFILFKQTPVWPKDVSEWGFLLSVGIAAFLGQCLNNKALQLSPAGPVLLMRNLDVLFAFVFGTLFFNETPQSSSLWGAALIMTGVLGLGLKKLLARNE
jgi:drug/metabolite transporter (DMT)-like permease